MLLFVVLIVALAVSVQAFAPRSKPAYCSSDMSKYAIAPLSAAEKTRVSELAQVQAFFRHGSRIPWNDVSCWKDYDVTWDNCNTYTMNLPQQSGEAAIEQSVLFRKVYDGSPNKFGGNCMTGQLVAEGYKQEQTLGKFLRAAYMNPTSNLRLFPDNQWSESVNKQVYFRSDDETRTLMSGQLVMANMFDFDNANGAVIDIHTGDYDLDQIYPNSAACPRLSQLSSAAYKSAEFVQYNTSEHVLDMQNRLNSIFGGAQYWQWNHYLDCTMTALCTDRELPDGDDPSMKMTESLFYEALAHVEWIWAYQGLYDDSAYSKLAMGRLLYQMKQRMMQVTSPMNGVEPLKLGLYASHDSTLMPILAALLGKQWDGKWASYASMVSFELYKGTEGNPSFMFRLVYNGKPLKVPGCAEYLCDVEVLYSLTSFAQEDMPCAKVTSRRLQSEALTSVLSSKIELSMYHVFALIGSAAGVSWLLTSLTRSKLTHKL